MSRPIPEPGAVVHCPITDEKDIECACGCILTEQDPWCPVCGQDRP